MRFALGMESSPATMGVALVKMFDIALFGSDLYRPEQGTKHNGKKHHPCCYAGFRHHLLSKAGCTGGHRNQTSHIHRIDTWDRLRTDSGLGFTSA